MKKLLSCRRSLLSLVGMVLLFVLGIVNKVDVSMAIAGIVASVAASNAYQGSKEKKE